ncbi:MAG: pyruvate kinase [Planctomycetota bacterium]
MPKTRFICTIGPKTLEKSWLDQLHAAGMNIARVNGAHGSIEDVERMVRTLKKDLPAGVEILLDLPGNKIRTDGITEPIPLTAGEEFVITPEMLTYRPLYKSVKAGARISAADGSIQLDVEKVEGQNIHTRVVIGGPLANRKGVNIAGIHGQIPFDFERDISLLNIAISAGVDYVGLSFVRRAEHVRRVRAQLVGTGVRIVAKVETAEAVRDVDAVLANADVIMIDRGDLEAEIGKENVPLTQKMVLERAREVKTPVIIASQFLTSMMTKPLPFMAEVSDVANAVLDGADILMLSEETAIGEYPIECIATMKNVARTVWGHMERDFDAVILAAGPSNGFGSLTTNKHKCMLDVGGTTIISHQIENLALAGIDSTRVTVVTGHNQLQVEHYLKSEGFKGEFVYNPWFQTTNMATSLWLTRQSNPAILVYGDIIFDPAILEDLIAKDGDIVLVVDRRADLDAEDEKVVVEDGRVVRASKDLKAEDCFGEFIGLAKVTRAGARIVWEEIDRMVKEGLQMSFFTEVIERLARRGVAIEICLTQNRPWADNDTLADLGVSREKVYPRIRENRAGAGLTKTEKTR